MYIDAGDSEQCKVGTRIYKWKNNKLEIVTVVKIENKNEPVKFYNVISTNYYNIIANDVITTDPTTAFSNIYGFKEDAIYSNNFYEISKGQEMPYTLVNTFMPYYLYKGLNLKNAMFLINNKNITYNFLFAAVSDRTVETIIKNGKRYFIITTSLDNVTEYNIERHLYKEGSFYKFPKNGAKYFIDTFTNKKYEPGETIIVENSMFFKAIN